MKKKTGVPETKKFPHAFHDYAVSDKVQATLFQLLGIQYSTDQLALPPLNSLLLYPS